MYEELDYEIVRVNVALQATATMSSTNNSQIFIPAGKVVGMAAVVAGNTENRIIDLSVLDNNNEVIKPCDVRFFERTAGGTFKDSLRPVSFLGGKTFECRLVALTPSATQSIITQVIFLIEKPILD